MGRSRFFAVVVGCAGLLGFVSARAATLTQQVDPPTASVGDEVTVSISVVNGGGGANVDLPRVDGLQLAGTSTATNITMVNGAFSSTVSQIFTLVPTRAGDYTIPAFDVHASDGQVLHAHEMKLHIVNAPGTVTSPNAPVSSGGPVVTPPASPDQGTNTANGNAADLSGGTIKPPVDPDGRPAKVFMLVTPGTTDAYVGETIPMRIEWFIRMDSIAQQDSLPTIEGSNFLMNDLSVRPQEDEVTIGDEAYHRETWVTAISAPKTGDFPLEIVRDTYWTKSPQGIFSDPLGNFFGPNPSLVHGNVASNQFTVHVHSLPEEGRPPGFTGAIGQFKAAGNASPVSVNVGEPVYLDFNVSGQGNFDYVRCPALAPDPAWKSYVASSKVNYTDESRTQGEKDFHQAIIPQKSGALPLPEANFSYFDPIAKKYVVLPIPLPPVTAMGIAVALAAAPAPGAEDAVPSPAAAPPTDSAGLLPNRLEFGSMQTDLTPAFRQTWFWAVQAAAFGLVLLAAPLLFFATRRRRGNARAERALRRQSLHELEDAMSAAVLCHDAPAFFLAARQAVQLQWGAAWGLAPEAVTLPLMAERDPALAERLAPLFAQADEVMYSGGAAEGIDLPAWDQQVREELRQLEPA